MVFPWPYLKVREKLFFKMPNTNHQQMRNSTETKNAFEDLFGGGIPNTQFFHTDKR